MFFAVFVRIASIEHSLSIINSDGSQAELVEYYKKHPEQDPNNADNAMKSTPVQTPVPTVTDDGGADDDDDALGIKRRKTDTLDVLVEN